MFEQGRFRYGYVEAMQVNAFNKSVLVNGMDIRRSNQDYIRTNIYTLVTR